MLVAQALVEPMRLMTHDTLVAINNNTIIKINLINRGARRN
jgi:hypothetical protein